MDVAHTEAVEAELNSFLERRARQAEDARRTEEAWRESVRLYNARQRRDLDALRHEYHAGQAARLRRTMESLVSYHVAEAAKYLPKGAL